MPVYLGIRSPYAVPHTERAPLHKSKDDKGEQSRTRTLESDLGWNSKSSAYSLVTFRGAQNSAENFMYVILFNAPSPRKL